MSTAVETILTLTVLAVSISAYLRARHWARKAEKAAEHAEKYAERIRELRDAENIRIIKGHGR